MSDRHMGGSRERLAHDPRLIQLLRSVLSLTTEATRGRFARRWAPRHAFGRHSGPGAHDARDAAVVILLSKDERSGWTLPLILRPPHMSSHAGQVALPGGRRDAGESLEACALRELSEELGVAQAEVEVLGRLDPVYVFASNFLIHPFVACRAESGWAPAAAEVAAVLELSVERLLRFGELEHWRITRHGISYDVPFFECQGQPVWGATCAILGALRDRLDEAPRAGL